MFCVVSCSKYSRKTLRVVDFGNSDPKALLARVVMGECPLCGPCSHVELDFGGYFNIHSQHDTADDALEAARLLDAESPGSFELPYKELQTS